MEIMRIYGPYLRKDGRKHVCILHPDGRRQTKSYPKYLMENHLGRELTLEETVDHIDDDFTNNDILNLQILTRVENIKKYKDQNKAVMLNLTCKCCGILFERREAVELYNRNIRLLDGPFCSQSCVGTVYH